MLSHVTNKATSPETLTELLTEHKHSSTERPRPTRNRDLYHVNKKNAILQLPLFQMSKSTSHSISTGLWSHLRCHVMAHAPPGSKGMCVGVQNKHTKPHAKTQVFCRRCNFAGCVAKRCVDIESDDRMSRSFFLFCGVAHDVLRRIRRIRRITTYYDVLRH